jgi:cytochrome c-type biogenesis protein
METLFTLLTETLQGGFFLALAASFAWGAISILLSPCHLASIPLIIGFLTSSGEQKASREISLSFIFALGILLTIAVIGAITAALGRIMGDIGSYGRYGIAVIFFIFGLYLMDIVRLPSLEVNLHRFVTQSAYKSALSLGLIFGIALGPCAFAFMAPVLAMVFQVAQTNIVGGGALMLCFGLGHCGVIVAAGGLTSRIQTYFNWTNRSNALLWTKRSAGFLVTLGGIYAVYIA